MKEEAYPLLEFFNVLRKAGLPLGINDYTSLLRAFNGGFGVESVDSLMRICRAMWVNSEEEERLFHFHFSRIEPELRRRQKQVLQQKAAEQEKRSVEEAFTSDALTELPEIEEAEEMKSSLPETPETEPSKSPEPIKMNDETAAAQAVSAVQTDVFQTEEISNFANRFILRGNYFPITRRQMKQTWRYLRCFVRDGEKTEIDVNATVERISRQGFFIAPVTMGSRVNRMELLVLIDRNGSMVPFHALSERLRDTALRGGKQRKVNVYYFHNVPSDWLYTDSALVDAEKTDDVLSRLHGLYSRVLIFTDAGAARSNYNPVRIKGMTEFLQKLKNYTNHAVCLNPMPVFRWPGTSADEISDEISMFEMSRQGFDEAVSTLRKQN